MRSFCNRVKLAQSALILLALSAFANAATEVAVPVAHIALLLPMNSPGLGPAASAVYQGISAGSVAQGLPLRVYSDFDETRGVVATYKSAVDNGAVAVIGPLTRGGIRQLAVEKTLPVPALALNIVEGPLPPQLYLFGMNIEGEARQIAILARKQGMKKAIVVTSREPLAQRLQFAFEEQWAASGGTIFREIEYSGNTMVFADIAAEPDNMVFFATSVEQSRTIRPYLPNNLASYATSQLFTGNRDTLLNFDFDGIRFVDMPWLMQTMPYPRANPPMETDRERLYALGIDAYRLTNILIARLNKSSLPMEGATGRIRLDGQTFVREALPSLFVQGHAQAADAPVAPGAQMFPDQYKAASQVEAPLPLGLAAKP